MQTTYQVQRYHPATATRKEFWEPISSQYTDLEFARGLEVAMAADKAKGFITQIVKYSSEVVEVNSRWII